MEKSIVCPKCGEVFSVDDATYASIVNQVKNAEFSEEVERRLHELMKQQEIEVEKNELTAQKDFESKLNAKVVELGRKDGEIARLQEQLRGIGKEKELEYTQQLSKKDEEISRLNATIQQSASDLKVAVLQEQKKAQDDIQEKNAEIASLNAKINSERSEAQSHELALRQTYEQQLKDKQELVDYYKDFKTRQTTKMIGESLEVHCSTLYNTTLRSVLPTAYFEKDNDASEGSKGDFIFRDWEDGIEYVSIMFEMKNELENGGKKHKNEDFFRKLDEDRRKKNCEYAVLVSLLEPESELYNNGIVDVSYRYPKMYVIRPQFFIPIITLLVQTSKKSVELQKKLIVAQSQSIDVTNFESKLIDFKDKFSRNVKLAADKFDTAIDEIDKSIDHLNKIKENLLGSKKHLLQANDKADGLTIKKLTYRNATMKQKFEEARAKMDSEQ